jgi:uncharacterized Zn-binding protein involved in type VI secretion
MTSPSVRLRVLPSVQPREIEVRNTGTMIQWRLGTGEWQDLIAVADITGPQGPVNQLRVDADYIQWQGDDGTWNNLVAIADLAAPLLDEAEAARDAAQAAQTAAETAQEAAEAAAAGVNLPPILAGDADKQLFVTATEDGYELREAARGSGSRLLTDWVDPDGTTDNTADLILALTETKHLIIPMTANNWVFSGDIPCPSDTVVQLAGCAIDLTVDGNTRGFWFQPGTTDAIVRGAALINLDATTSGDEGSYNGAFTWSQFYYGADPDPVLRCHVDGYILVNCIGAANTKPINMYGYTEDCYAKGVRATGQTNFAFSAHWGGNGSSGVLPTKTWHPHNFQWIDCEVYSTSGGGNTLRGFTASGCGRVSMIRCRTDGLATIGFNLFVGDYGYTYAENITDSQAADFYLEDIDIAVGDAIGFTSDFQSSRLNGSPCWTGSDHHAKLIINGLKLRMTAASATGILFLLNHFKQAKVDGLTIIEEQDGHTTNAIDIFGCVDVEINGRAIARNGTRIRNCGKVAHNVAMSQPVPIPDTTLSMIGPAAASETGITTVGAILAGATSIVLTGVTLVAGAGGFIRYNDGSTEHEIELLTSTYSDAAANQTVQIVGAPVNIPSGASITLIQTVKSLTLGPAEIRHARYGLRATGSATAKVRNIDVSQAMFRSLGLFAVSAEAVDGFSAIGADIDDHGKTTTTTDVRGIVLGANCENYRVLGAKFGKKNTNMRYAIYCDNASKQGVVDACIFEKLNASATTPVCIFKSTAANVTIGSNNINVTGLALT